MSIEYSTDEEAYDAIQEVLRFYQTKEEILWALGEIRSYIPTRKVLVEIGSLYGGTLSLLSRLIEPGGTAFSIEPELEVPLPLDTIKELIPHVEVIHIAAPSNTRDAFYSLVGMLDGRKIDVLMIDGSHEYKDTKRDFETYSELVSRQGMILFHDVMSLGSGVLWAEIKDKYRSAELVVDPPAMGIGIIYMEE